MYGFLLGLRGYREGWYRDLRELTQGRSFVKRRYRAFLFRGLLRPTKRTYNIGCTILHQRYALFTSFTLCYCILHPFSAGGHFLLRIVGDKAYVKISPANRVFLFGGVENPSSIGRLAKIGSRADMLALLKTRTEQLKWTSKREKLMLNRSQKEDARKILFYF